MHSFKLEDCFWQDGSERLAQQLDFLVEADKIKKIFRQTQLIHDDRYENDAEHAWHFALFGMILAEHGPKGLDANKVIRMALIHDLVEIDAGDVVVYDTVAREAAKAKEEAAAERIFGLLPEDQTAIYRKLWKEFEAQESSEAKFAAAMDRMQPLLHNYLTQGYTWKKHGITKAMVLETNGHIKDGSPELWQVIEQMVELAVEKGYLQA